MRVLGSELQTHPHLFRAKGLTPGHLSSALPHKPVSESILLEGLFCRVCVLFSSHTGEDHFSSFPLVFSFAFDVVLGWPWACLAGALPLSPTPGRNHFCKYLWRKPVSLQEERIQRVSLIRIYFTFLMLPLH